MQLSDRVEWLFSITQDSVQPPPCAYEVAILLAKHANSETGEAYPGLGSKLGKDNARRGAKWLRDRGWIVPVREIIGRQTTYRLVAEQHRVQSSTGCSLAWRGGSRAAQGEVAELLPGGSKAATGGGSRAAPLTSNEPVMNRESTGQGDEQDITGVSTPDPLPKPSHYARFEKQYQTPTPPPVVIPWDQTPEGKAGLAKAAAIRAARLKAEGKA